MLPGICDHRSTVRFLTGMPRITISKYIGQKQKTNINIWKMYKQGISEKRLLCDDREAGNGQRRGLRDATVHILKRFYPRFAGTAKIEQY